MRGTSIRRASIRRVSSIDYDSDRIANAGVRSPSREDRRSYIVPIRILVVDDEPNILGAMEPLLRSHGYEVITAMTGRAAIAAATRESPD